MYFVLDVQQSKKKRERGYVFILGLSWTLKIDVENEMKEDEKMGKKVDDDNNDIKENQKNKLY